MLKIVILLAFCSLLGEFLPFDSFFFNFIDSLGVSRHVPQFCLPFDSPLSSPHPCSAPDHKKENKVSKQASEQEQNKT